MTSVDIAIPLFEGYNRQLGRHIDPLRLAAARTLRAVYLSNELISRIFPGALVCSFEKIGSTNKSDRLLNPRSTWLRRSSTSYTGHSY